MEGREEAHGGTSSKEGFRFPSALASSDAGQRGMFGNVAMR
jgi:hypothetical protein